MQRYVRLAHFSPATTINCSLHLLPLSPTLLRRFASYPTQPQFDWLCREKIADGPLIAKWRKPGYEILCSMLAIQKGNHNFGTTSHCRVPLRLRAAQVSEPTSSIAGGSIFMVMATLFGRIIAAVGAAEALVQ